MNTDILTEPEKQTGVKKSWFDDTLMSKDDFFAKIDHSRQQAKEGKVTTVHSKEELMAFLDSL